MYPTEPQEQPQAVTSIDISTGIDMYFSYNANGNMISRWENGTTYTQNFNVENELVSVVNGSNTTSPLWHGVLGVPTCSVFFG